MKPKAFVIQPPLVLSRHFIDYPYFANLGAYQAAAVLRSAGRQVQVIDGFASEQADLYKHGKYAWLGEPEDRFLGRLDGLQAGLVVINGGPFLNSALCKGWLVKLIERLGACSTELLVLAEMYTGGMHYIETDGQVLLDENSGLDLVLRYEGEQLLERLAGDLDRGNIPDREVWENHDPFGLDTLPAPAFDLMDHEKYFSFLGRVLSSAWRPGPFPAQPDRTLPLVTQRGCPYSCLFCTSNPGLEEGSRKVRAVPVKRIEQWISKWVRDYAVERLVVLDDVVNLDPERFDSLLAIIEEMNLAVEFPNGLRADRIKEEHVRRLRSLTSGIKVSLESASLRVQQEVLGKNLNPAAVEEVAGWCKRHDVPLQIHYMIGIPGERKEEINSTLKMAGHLYESYGARSLLQFATPLRGSKLHKLCEEKRLLTEEPEDIHACFQEHSIIKTSEFEPVFLKICADNYTKALAETRQRKVIVNLTYRCNNHCVFCAVGDRPKEDADINVVLSALKRYRQEGFELLDIDGGEPTLHEKLFTVVEEGRHLGYRKISLITNARRSSYPAYARRLVDSGIDEVLVSLHAGDQELHERLTGARGSYQQTLTGIENLLKFIGNPERVAINTTLVKNNISDCEKLGKMLERMEIRRWNLQVVTPFGRAKAEQVPEEDELKRRLTGLLTKLSGKMNIQIVNCPPCLVPGFEEKAALDFNKAARDMVFVGQAGENLQDFLSQRRKQDKRCSRCAYMILCPGSYVF